MPKSKIMLACCLVWMVMVLQGCQDSEPPIDVYTHSGLGSLAADFSQDGNHALISTVDQGVQYWDIKNNKLVFKLTHHKGQPPEVISLKVAEKAPVAVTVDANSLIAWDLTTGKAFRFWSLNATPLDLAISSTGKYGLISLNNYKTQLINLTNGTEIQNFSDANLIQKVAISPDSKYLALGDEMGKVRIWDLNAGRIKLAIEHKQSITQLQFSANSAYLLSSSAHDTSWIHDIRNGQQISALDFGSKYFLFGRLSPAITSSTFSTDGQWLVTGHPPKTIRIWQTSSGKLVKRFDVPLRTNLKPTASIPLAVELTPDQQFLLCETSNGQGYRFMWPMKAPA